MRVCVCERAHICVGLGLHIIILWVVGCGMFECCCMHNIYKVLVLVLFVVVLNVLILILIM